MTDIHSAYLTRNPYFTCLENLPVQTDDLYLVYCGKEKCRPGHRFGPNQRHFHIIHFIKAGRGTLDMRGHHYDLGPGDIFWIPPGEEAWYEADMKVPWIYYWIGFDGFSANICLERAELTPDTPVLRAPELIEEVTGYINGMLDANQLTYSNSVKRNALLQLTMASLIDRAERMHKPEDSYAYTGAVYAHYARNYIDLNYSEQIRVSELADFIGVNRSYLSSSFKQLMGMSIQDYIVGVRMNRARSLLRGTDLKVNEIAQMVGYEDVLSFSKIFKAKNGMSPKSYRDVDTNLETFSEKVENSDRENKL